MYSDRVIHAFRAQLEARQAALAAGATHVGWKVALGVAAVDDVMGSDPVFGYLTSATRLQSGDSFTARATGQLRAESEVALRLGRAIRSTDNAQTIRAAISGVAPALELVDVARFAHDFERVVASNVYHLAFAVGSFEPLAPGSTLSPIMQINGELSGSATIANDFTAKLAAIVRLLEAVGEGLAANDVIITGSHIHLPVTPGDTIEVAISPLSSRVRVTITE